MWKETIQQIQEGVRNEIVASWKVENSLARPLVFLIGGFQGAGKTTLLENIKGEFGLTIISLDEVRERLFELGMSFSSEFIQTVDWLRDILVYEAVKRGISFAVDTNMTPDRIGHVREIVEKENTNYQFQTVFLDAPVSVLENRLRARPKLAGRYKGSVDELYGSIEKHGQIDKKQYNIMVETANRSPSEVAQIVREYLGL